MPVSERCSALRILYRKLQVPLQFLLFPYPTAASPRPRRLKRRFLFFEACFAAEKTFMRYAGKERMASLAIRPLVSRTGARFTRQDRKNERRLHGRLERFNRSPIAQSATTSLGSRPSASTHYFPTKPVGFLLWISTRSPGWQMPRLLLPHVNGFRSPRQSSARDPETVRTSGFSSTAQCSLPMPDSLVVPC